MMAAISVKGLENGDSQVGDFKSFISTEYGFGTVDYKNGKTELQVAFGEIPVREIIDLKQK